MWSWLRKDNRLAKERFFLRNGGLVLEKLINSCDGKSNPIPAFSANDLLEATNNYAPDRILYKHRFYTLYKGIHESRMITVKKFENLYNAAWEESILEESIREVVIGSQNHKNVLKLLGCCLETQFPIPVFEFASNGFLSDYIYEEEEGKNPSENRLRLSWESRLRIATEIADALSYIHMGFSQIIIHRDVKPSNILLDKNWVAKLSDFTLSVSIPLGETHAEPDEIAGTRGYFAPECFHSGGVTEKVDVYSFGMLLLEFLTGRSLISLEDDHVLLVDRAITFIENGCDGEIVKPIILEGGVDQQQLQASIELALGCVEENDDQRPSMMDVAKQLRQIRKTSERERWEKRFERVGEVEEKVMSWSSSSAMPLLSLNHVSFLCKSLGRTIRFYEEVLGFVLIKRPSSFKFQGAWLFNYGIGIHLLQCNSPNEIQDKQSVINPKENHISFECSDMLLLIRKLEEMNIEYVTAVVEEGGVKVDQLFFHDPDGYIIEICNCQNLPILPLSSCPLKKLPYSNEENNISPPSGKQRWKLQCAREVEALMMDNLVTDMMGISF